METRTYPKVEQYLKVTTSSDNDVFIVLPWAQTILGGEKKLHREFLHSIIHLQLTGNMQQLVDSSRK